MLDYIRRGSAVFVSSYQLYHALSLPPRKYSDWTHKRIFENQNVIENEDFLHNIWYEDHLPNRGIGPGRPIKDLLLRRHLAVALCLQSRSANARKIKIFLLREPKGHTPPSS